MADNVSITAGSGTTIAADEPASGAAAGAKVQRVKPMVGPDGEATDVSVANPMPVDDDASQALLTLIKGLLEGTAVVKVTDNAGSLTVDAPLATPVGVRLSDGSEAIGSTSKRLWVDDGGSSLTIDGEVTAKKIAEALPAGANSIGKIRLQYGTGPTDVSNEAPLPVNVQNEPGVKLLAGTNAFGKLSANAGVNIGNVGLAPQTSGGLEIKRLLSAASTNATKVKESPGQVFGWYIFNTSSSVKYVKLYNKASAPTVGTDTPVMTIPVPKESGTNIEYVNGIAFATGIALATTKAVADANTEAVAENDLIINLLYK